MRSQSLALGALGLLLSSSLALGAVNSECGDKNFIFDKENEYVKFDGVKYTKASIPAANAMKFDDGLAFISQLYLGDMVSPGDLDKDGEISFLRYTNFHLDKGLKGDRVDAKLVTVGVISQKRKVDSKTYLCEQNSDG